MNRNFVFDHQHDRQGSWSRTASTLNKWLWGALCCGVPGVPCQYCNCCERLEDGGPERERTRVNRALRSCKNSRSGGSGDRMASSEYLSAIVVLLEIGRLMNLLQEREDGSPERDRRKINRSTATVERTGRPHRPHAPRGRKHTPETLSAVRCALSQLQGEPAILPAPPEYRQRPSPEPG
ncbi:hypothetical protein PYW07_004116 [Mythimna separata]|uniref:Uncharacterized protein n=1 Tax=Mythimna separata TaxID=271217 RepID=A0AAD7YP40_MYTSE|nr:hypothetical protein PYW07_004116 [Mythimna separata]